jgi:CRP-like cAMP-binding protein
MPNRFINKLQGLVSLADDDIRALAEATAKRSKFSVRQHLIREGDRPGSVFVVLDGWAIRYKTLPSGTRQIMAFLMPGDSCDLFNGLLAEMDHSIETVTNATVATISREKIDEIMSGHPAVARAMYIAQLIDEGTLRSWIVSLGRRNSVERAAHLLLELYIRAVQVGIIVGGEMELPLTQAILADALGMTPVHVNRVLQSLRKTGAIHLQRGLLRIPNPDLLIKFSGFDENYLHRRMRRPDGN